MATIPELKPDECRVLGVLVEKAMTTPQQYPLTLNALVSGCNQKNNRLPVVTWDEDRVMDALDGLRHKGLVREAMLSGSRVAKFRHLGREVLGVDTPGLVLLTELLLRGPQSIGEIRQNASRMHPIESLETAKAVLDGLMQAVPGEVGEEGRPALVKEFPPPPGSRARVYAQLLCPGLHPIQSGGSAAEAERGEERGEAVDGGVVDRVAALEMEVARLKSALSRLASRLGEPDPLL
ncbi:MAG: YceH family protein [Phycisphaerales bacterium]|nr:YceH family protein [Phycisphaerales bacterium]